MNLLTIASEDHIYGFEGTAAQSIFIAGFAGLVLIAMVVTKMSLRQWVLTGVLLITCLAPSLAGDFLQYNPTWLLPVQTRRPEIHLLLGCVLTVVVIGAGSFSVRLIPAQGIIMLIMAMYAGTLQFVQPGTEASEALQAIGFALATIPCVIVASSLTARSHEGCESLLKMMMWVSAVWAFLCSVQFIINPQYLVSHQGRFVGMLGNAQHTAVYVGPMAVVALWLLVHGTSRKAKIFWATMIGVNLLFLLWTASRTGAMMFVIGTTAVLYTRVGRAIALLPVVGLIAWGLAVLADALQIGSNLSRFVNVEDNRSWLWASQIENAMEHPFLGVGFQNVAGTENSYLGAFAVYGVGYFMLTIALAAVSLWQCMRMVTQRRSLPTEQRPMIDICVAFFLMYFAGALFEGYIHARSFCPQVLLLIFSSISLWVRQEIAVHQSDEHLSLQGDEPYGYGDSIDAPMAHE